MSAPRAAPSALAVSSDTEKAAVLDELVAAADVANAVVAAPLTVDQEDLAAHAGRTRYGYVEPTEAAWSLLGTAVEPWLEDIERRASLGLTEAARRLGLGILEALRRIDRHIGNDDLLISWVPELPSETADRVIELLNALGHKLTEADLAHASAKNVGVADPAPREACSPTSIASIRASAIDPRRPRPDRPAATTAFSARAGARPLAM